MKHTLIAVLLFSLLSCSLITSTCGLTKAAAKAADIACRALKVVVKVFPLKRAKIEKVSFILRTPCRKKEIFVNDASQFRDIPDFDANKKTVFFVTGWKAKPDAYYVNDMAKAHTCRGDNNFVVVNTGGLMRNGYVNAASLTATLGKYVAVGIINMGIPAENVHLVGHSLGAHIVGSAGRHYHNLTSRQIERITGLDPASPCFMKHPVFPRLDKSDAKFVDIIHTNPNELGILKAIGDVDFYPGGYNLHKKGCKKKKAECSHQRAIQYYIESVYPGNEQNFMALQCTKIDSMQNKSCNGHKSFMGYIADMQAKGTHYVSVGSQQPYGRNAGRYAAIPSINTCGTCPKRYLGFENWQ